MVCTQQFLISFCLFASYTGHTIYISVLYMYMFNKTEHAISHGFYSIFKFDIINKYIEMLQLDRVVFL